MIRNKQLDYDIVDARSGARFRSEVDEPRAGSRRGNIPGSKNVFFKDLLNQDGTFKSNDEIKQIFDKAGIDLDKNVALSCGSSVTASVINFALDLVGHKKDRYTYGPSWSEYGSKPHPDDSTIEKEHLAKASWYKAFTSKSKKH